MNSLGFVITSPFVHIKKSRLDEIINELRLKAIQDSQISMNLLIFIDVLSFILSPYSFISKINLFLKEKNGVEKSSNDLLHQLT